MGKSKKTKGKEYTAKAPLMDQDGRGRKSQSSKIHLRSFINKLNYLQFEKHSRIQSSDVS